jgi:hypothetical protein
MTASRARRCSASVLALAFSAWIVSASPVAAQTVVGEPIELFPPDADSITGVATGAEPAAGIEETVPGDPGPESLDVQILTDDPWSTLPVDGSEEIVVGTLPELEGAGIGLLTEQSGGLPPHLWQGTEPGVAEMLLGRLPGDARSPAMRTLARRALLSAGAPPAGSTEGDFLQARAEALVSLGNLTDAVALLRLAPERDGDALLARLEVETAFLADDAAGACARVRAFLGQSDSVFWQRALIYCQILGGQAEAALLGLNLLEEMGDDDDPAFADLARRLANGQGEGEIAVRSPTSLHLAMMRSADLAVDENQIRNMSPAVLAAAVDAVVTSVAVRLRLAERAHGYGMLSTDRLTAVYEAVAFTPDELASPLSVAETMEQPLARALLYQTAIAQRVAIARAEVLQRAWHLSLVDGHYLTVVHATAALARGLTPAPELGWFAADAVRAMIAVGDADAAARWLALAEQTALRSPDGARAVVDLWPLVQLDDPDRPLDRGRLNAWWDSQGRLPEPQRRDRISVLFSLLDAVGVAVPATYWTQILPGPARVTATVPATPVWYALGRASAELHIGESVLLSLMILGNGGPATASEPVLATVISSLTATGLTAEARAIAVEAALAAGF